MALNPPGALARWHLPSPSLNPAVVGGRGTLANIDMHASASLSAQPAAAPGGDDGSSSSLPPPPSPWPKLLLDSGASFHMVGDPRLLSDLHDAPAGKTVTVGDGNTLPVTKIGDIQMITAGFTIPGVFLVPGLKFNLISVHQLTRIRICTWFDGDRAMLYAGPELVGVAVAQENLAGPYVLQFLRMPENAADASSGNYLDEEIKLVPAWCGSYARTPWLQPQRYTWSQFMPLRIHTRKQLRFRIHMQKQLPPPPSLLPMHGDDGSSSPPSPPKLLLDSGASFHVVSDPRLLSNLRDAPAGLRVRAADGNTMPVTKIGDIQITAGFTIPGVRLVPGLKVDGVISVCRLARESRISTWFVGDRAKLYAGPKLVGVAVAPQENLAGLYVLQIMRTPKIAAA